MLSFLRLRVFAMRGNRREKGGRKRKKKREDEIYRLTTPCSPTKIKEKEEERKEGK